MKTSCANTAGTVFLEDADTMRAIAAWCDHHDEASAAWLVKRFRPLVSGIAHCRMPTWALAEDVVQDAFTQIFASLHRYRPLCPFGAWIARLTAHRCSTHLAYLVRRRWFEHRGGNLSVLDNLGNMQDEGAANPECDDGESAALCRELLASVNKSDRELLMLRYVEGLSAEEVARRNGLSAGAVRVRVCRASRALRVRLGQGRHRFLARS